MKKSIRDCIRLMMLIGIFFLVGRLSVEAAEVFSISKSSVKLNVGDTLDLDVTGNKKEPVWSSNNINIVRVNQDGMITGVRKGKTTVKVRDGLKYKKCTVSVVVPSINMSKKSATIYYGGTGKNTIKLNANVKSGASKVVEWSTSDATVAVVDEKGVVTSKGEGTAIISACANGISTECIITVKNTAIILSVDKAQLGTKGIGRCVKIVPTVIGSSKGVKWTSSDKTVATVSGGKVTGKKDGRVIITATANGVSASCEVTVVENLLSFNEESMLLYMGETGKLKWNSTKEEVSFQSSNPQVIDYEVAANGKEIKILPLSAGESNLEIRSGGKTDSCLVTVKEPCIDIKEEEVILKTKGTEKTFVLNKEVIGRKNTVKWTSSDSKVVNVSNGKLTALKEGNAIITATANGTTDRVNVIVQPYDPTITLDKTEYVLYTNKGNKIKLNAKVNGISKTVVWETLDEAVATVHKGTVTAVGEGETVITATANGVSAQCKIQVLASKVILEKEQIRLAIGEKAELPVDIIGTGQSVKWKVGNSKIVSVKNGVITAKKCGQTEIKVTANGVTAVCQIEVGEEHQHNYEAYVTKATCTEGGYTTYICSCKDSYIGEETEALGHSYKSEIIEPSCMEEGYTTYSCERCQDSYKGDETEALEHWYESELIMPSCTEKGYISYTCKFCGDYYKGEELETLEHKYEAKITKPSCTKGGYTTYTCDCGDSYRGNETNALGHSYKKEAIMPGCIQAGSITYTCRACEESYREEIPALGHTYKETATEATCTKGGLTTYVCNVCKESCQKETSERGHKLAWVIKVTPTETTEGERMQYCIQCGDVMQLETLPKLDGVCRHYKTKETIVEWGTCSTPQYIKIQCSDCGYVINERTSTGEYDEFYHPNAEYEKLIEPTINHEGVVRQSCSECGMVDIYTIPKSDYCYHENTEIKTMDGKDYECCIDCEEVLYAINPNCNHKGYSKKEVLVQEVSTTQQGIVELVCSFCEDVVETKYIHPYEEYTIDLGNGQTEVVYGYYDDEESQEIFNLLNEYRMQSGLNTLNWNDSLNNVTKTRGCEISHTFSHTRPNGTKWYTLAYMMNGENIAGVASATAAMNGWKNSEGHNENMLGNYKTVNIAVFKRVFFNDNSYIPVEFAYYVQIFSVYE